MAFSLKVNGTEISQYIALRGLKWSRNDVDGANAGRTIQGDMIRDFLSTKDKIEITCRPLESEELATILALVEPTQANQGVMNITFTSPRGTTVTKPMYLSNVPASYLLNRGNTSLWNGVSLHFIEL